MVKLAVQCRLNWCFIHYKFGETTSRWTANYLDISKMVSINLQTIPNSRRNPLNWTKTWKTKKRHTAEYKNIIKQQYKKTRYSAVYLEKKLNI